LIAFLLYLLVYGRTLPVLGPGLLAAAAVAFGAMRRSGPWLRFGVLAALSSRLHSTARRERARHRAPPRGELAAARSGPQLVVTLMASRVLASDCDLSFVEFWRSDRLTGAVELQSLPAAVALGAFLTLVFYLAIPHMVSSSTRGHPAMIIVSALQGGTIVHITIVFLSSSSWRRSATRRGFTLADRTALARFREREAHPRERRTRNARSYHFAAAVRPLTHAYRATAQRGRGVATGTRGGFDRVASR